MTCPLKGDLACRGPVCGHCQRCKQPIDNHYDLTAAKRPPCPKV